VTAKVTSSAASDFDLAQAAARGDMEAFEALYERYYRRVYSLCLRMVANVTEAEDLTQDTFVNAWRSLPGYEGRSSFSTWLHRIAVNAVLAKRRSPQGRNEISMTDDAGEQMEFEAQGAMDEATPIDLERAIEALPPGARDVMVLHGIYGYSHEEAAGMLGVAVGTCKAQLHRARHLMRARMGAEAAT